MTPRDDGVAEPGAEGAPRDVSVLLSGIAQNVVGIGVAGVAAFVVQILTSRRLGAAGFGVVTLLTQAVFVVSFATRAGMDMAVLRKVAIEAGRGRWGQIRVPVARAALIAALTSAVAAAALVAGSRTVLEVLRIEASGGTRLVLASVLGLPFLALCNVWLAGTRGLKIMRYTLYVFWAGQNIAWIALSLVLWQISESTTSSVLAYSLSWLMAALTAGWFWHRESRAWAAREPESPWAWPLVRYAAPRAPAALFAQLLFWADLFVVTRYVSEGQVGLYSASLRSAQVVALFLASVNLVFAPFVADLFVRNERARLDSLFKLLTRWIIAATLPIVLVVIIVPDEVLRLFGSEFAAGHTALLIVLVGQFVNAATGSGGLVLIMIGRTGWDLIVYVGSLVANLTLAFLLCPRYGIVGAAVVNALTLTASNAVRLFLVRRFAGITPYEASLLRLLVPVLAGLAAMWLSHSLAESAQLVDLLGTGMIGILAYGISFVLFCLTSEERSRARAVAVEALRR
jgi:O-antigen/teichoic acid export membrane protein